MTMAIQSAREKTEMAIFDFEMAVTSAAHDMSGALERRALKEARVDLLAAIDNEVTARDDAVRAEGRRLYMAAVRARNDLREALEMNGGFTTPEGKIKYIREAHDKLDAAIRARAQPAERAKETE
jgi:hypothetical protein